MARKPVHLAAAGGKPWGRQGIWQAIRFQCDFSLKTLMGATDIHRDTIRDYLRGLEAAGYIERLNTLLDGSPLYRLVKDIGVEAPRVTAAGRPVTQGIIQEQMWRAMRMMRGDFSWRDLALMASTVEYPVAEAAAQDYCRNLAKAGYLVLTSAGSGGAKGKAAPARWRFNRARNTGPKAPMVQRVSSIYDPNLRKVVWVADGGHE